MDRKRKNPSLGGNIYWALLLLLVTAAFGGMAFLIASSTPPTQERTITVRARQYGYEPAIIRANRGDTIRLRFMSEDVVHGFYLEGHDIDVTIFPLRQTAELRRPSQPGKVELVEEVVFHANREGKFRYRCSQTCGFMHPFMLGELVVGPNRLFPVSIGLALGLLVGRFVVVSRKGERSWPARLRVFRQPWR